jgi:crotonobetainyl-CoA:carnitine CoA-transferase CaiB-like acyl-CoA transferase
MLLADMGASVSMVEALIEDGTKSETASERSAAFNALRRNKRSICIDLKRPEGREIFLELAAISDVVIEGFRPGVVERLGIAFEAIEKLNPRVVYCSLSGYGQSGPYRDLAGHDIDYIAIGGALGLVGRANGPPAAPLQLVGDVAGGGLMAAFSIMVALFERTRSGRGQYIDVAMSDGVVSLLTRVAGQFFQSGVEQGVGENRIAGALHFYDSYACADGRFLAVGALEPRFYANLCRILGLEDIVDIHESSPSEERERARARLAARFLERTRDAWFELLEREDTCAAPVLGLKEVFANPHHLHRRMLIELEHPALGTVRQVGIAPKLSRTPGRVTSLGPRPGDHTTEILRELGRDPPSIARLRELGVVA